MTSSLSTEKYANATTSSTWQSEAATTRSDVAWSSAAEVDVSAVGAGSTARAVFEVVTLLLFLGLCGSASGPPRGGGNFTAILL